MGGVSFMDFVFLSLKRGFRHTVYDFIHTYLLSAQHKLRFPTSQELPGGYAVFQSALFKTLK